MVAILTAQHKISKVPSLSVDILVETLDEYSFPPDIQAHTERWGLQYGVVLMERTP